MCCTQTDDALPVLDFLRVADAEVPRAQYEPTGTGNKSSSDDTSSCNAQNQNQNQNKIKMSPWGSVATTAEHSLASH